MKKLRLIFVALASVALFALPARADLEMTQELESGGKTAKLVTRFKKGSNGKLRWVRADQANGASLVTDFRKKRVIALSGETKVAAITRFRKMRKKYPGIEGVQVAAATPREEKVGEVTAKIYEGTVMTTAGIGKLTLWVAEDHPEKATVVPLVQAYAESPVLRVSAGLSESLKAAPGVVVKSEVQVGEHKVVTTLVSLQKRTLPEEIFEIPKDYTRENK